MKNATEIDGGVAGALVFRGGVYNDGSGCDDAAQTQSFPMHALKLQCG